MTIRRLAVGLVLATLLVGPAAAAATKPYQWTPQQASSALMRQAQDFYVDTTAHDLMAAKCRGTGKRFGARYVAFLCTAGLKVGLSDPTLSVRVAAKTRRAGGLCWSITPAAIPSGCLAAGVRGIGSTSRAWVAAYKAINDRNVGDGHCLAHGSGFFTCTWHQADGDHRGTVVFQPGPVFKLLQ